MSKFIILASLLMLAGCNIPDDAKTCAGYGFTPGTDAYANCQQNAEQGRSARRAAIFGAYLSRPRTMNCSTWGGSTSCSAY